MRLKDKLVLYLRLSRIHGAASESLLILIAAMIMGQTSILALFVLFCIGILYHIHVFVLNEYADIDVDRLSKDLKKKPLVSGDIPKNNARIIVVIAAITTIAITIVFFKSFSALLFLLLALLFGTLYDFYGKKIIGYSDTLIAASLSFIFLYGAGTVSEHLTTIIYIIAGMIFVAIIFANAVEGGLKDVDHDYLGGAKTLATLMGVTVNDGNLQISMRFRFFGCSLIGICFVLLLLLGYQPEIHLQEDEFGKTILIVVLSIIILVTSYRLLTLKKFDRAQIKRLYAVLNSTAGIMLLVLLVPLIGLVPTCILIIIPITWYVLFNIVLYGKPLQPLV